ncbi:hypothetical protein [Streptomyces spectabilis]|uniref:Uncharacterized protein n=1 Tax=Streptomyces spectabilis TaxID=68270 RepID=A0A7W8B0V7_STRST|nr:hypothetical protein [Streptomyces spectabilis]MBB5108017.1 hypothetical protein [Streptomyces spectabilis]
MTAPRALGSGVSFHVVSTVKVTESDHPGLQCVPSSVVARKV